MQKLHTQFNPSHTPVSEPIPGSTQVPNSGGGYAWEITPWQKLDRFLTLGTEQGSYYVSEQKLTQANATNVISLLKSDGARVIERATQISTEGKAYKNDPALFVFALAFYLGDEKTKKAAEANLSKVARIPTHLFTFIEYVNSMRGWGRSLKRVVGNWYNNKELSQLVYHVTKYQSRNGWSNKDALRLSHPKTSDALRNDIYSYIVGKKQIVEGMTGETWDFLRVVEKTLNENTPITEVVSLIKEFNLTHEVINNKFKNEKSVWAALYESMPLTALIRNLAKMTTIGLLAPFSNAAINLSDKLVNRDYLSKARIHPIQILAALKTYASGHGVRGGNSWTPVPQVTDALDKAFYLTFTNVEPCNKRILFGLDISSSMMYGDIGGVSGLSPREAESALALVVANTEKHHYFKAFSQNLVDFNVSPRERIDDVMNNMDRMPFGSTNPSLPIVWATKNNFTIDGFVTLTDNECNQGIHISQALNIYRRKINPNAKSIVVGMTSAGFSIADPNCSLELDIVGFSTDCPKLISDFIRG